MNGGVWRIVKCPLPVFMTRQDGAVGPTPVNPGWLPHIVGCNYIYIPLYSYLYLLPEVPDIEDCLCNLDTVLQDTIRLGRLLLTYL